MTIQKQKNIKDTWIVDFRDVSVKRRVKSTVNKVKYLDWYSTLEYVTALNCWFDLIILFV